MLSSCATKIQCTNSDKQNHIPDSKVCEWLPQHYSYYGIDHLVYESIHNSKEKPPLILLHQLPGLSKKTLDYAQTLTTKFSVYVPLLFGELNMDNFVYGSYFYLTNSEWQPRENRPIYEWARLLSIDISDKHPGKKMGVIGMCLTGAMPLALLENKHINSIVVSQPTLPIISITQYSKSSLYLSDLEYHFAKQRAHSGEVKILGLRFENDGLAKREKLKTLKTDFSDAYIDLEICQCEYEKYNIAQSAHSVLIDDWDKEQASGHPVNIRRQQVMQFFQAQLLGIGEVPTEKRCLSSSQ